MKISENINELAAALCKFQNESLLIVKDTQGYGYKYAQLSQVLQTTKPALFKHGLSISQLCSNDGANVGVETMLMHISGQYISSALSIPVEQKKGLSIAQTIGSTITYARRYAWCAILGIAVEEDVDGTVVMETEKPTAKNYVNHMTATLMNLINEKDVSSEQIEKWLKKADASNLKALSTEQMSAIIMHLESK